jgi:hypothetical protein
LNMNNQYINNVSNPVLNQDVATKAYVDQQISSGISYHQPVNAATTTTLAIATGGTTTYNSPNGASNGIGAYISTTGTFSLIDTVNIAVANSRILVKNEANAAWNGVYNYTNATAITRTSDTDEYGPDSVTQLSLNDYFFTQSGNVNLGVGFVVSAPTGTITFGTSNITFSTFSTSQIYSNGTGLGLAGTVFSIANTAVTAGSYGNGDSVATFTVNNQGQLTAASNTAITANAANLSGTTLKSTVVTSSLTSVGTLGNLTVTSNISGGNVAVTANTSTSNLVVGGSTPDTRVTIYGVGQSAIYSLTGNSTTTGTDIHISGADSSQTRITQDSFGNSNSYVAFTGRSSRGSAATPLQSQTNDILSQFTGRGFSNGSLQFGNASTGRVDVVAAENFTDTSRATKVLVYTTSAGNITPTATATFDSAGGFTATGNVSGANINGTFYGAGTGLTSIPGANVTGTVPTATTAGTVTTAAQPNITSTGTLTSLGVSGAVTASTLVSNVATGTAPITVTSTTRVANLSVAYANVSDYSVVSTATTGNYYLNFVNALTGNVQEYANSVFVANVSNGAITATTFVGALSGAATSATTAGTVTTAAQPNITSVGTLTSLTLGGTLTGAVQIGTGTATHYGTTLTTGANSTAGTITGNWTLSAGSRLNATYADLAEKYVADAEYAPGTVLVFGGDEEVTLANTFDSTRVAGVVTTNPAYTMNNACEGEHVVNIALQGRVPVLVSGNVAKGDLMVTGENGRAVANNEARAGTIIGKALVNFIGNEGTIEVAVGRF